MHWKKINKEVLFTEENPVRVSLKEIGLLKKKAEHNKRRRIRLCIHKDTDDKLHTMLIVHTKGAYIKPHKHLNKTESLHVIEGSADLLIFDESGKVVESIQMGERVSGKRFYYRISQPLYHSLIVTSDFFIFHETTTGPFSRRDTVFASWAPDEEETKKIAKFTSGIKQDCKAAVYRNGGVL